MALRDRRVDLFVWHSGNGSPLLLYWYSTLLVDDRWYFFSALEPLAFLGMAIYAISMAKRGGRQHPNKTALSWTIGCSVLSFVGAGFLGFAHTLPQVNMYTHGTLVTAMMVTWPFGEPMPCWFWELSTTRFLT